MSETASVTPPPYVPQDPQSRGGRAGLGTAALVLGIVGIVFAVIPATTGFGIFLGVLSLALGIVGIKKKGRRAVAGTVLGGVALVLGASLSGVYGSSGNDSAAPAEVTATTAADSTSGKADTKASDVESTPEEAAKPAKPKGSVGQLQALAAAKGYLSSGMGFSSASLLQQLTSSAGNGFPEADAQWAIGHSSADWNAQALSAAKGYLDSGMGFSSASLTGQLTSSAGNQFTPEQAQYAVSHSEADWNEQAVDAAKGYISSGMGFSRSSLVEQLTSSAGNQFTPEQAEYAAGQVGL